MASEPTTSGASVRVSIICDTTCGKGQEVYGEHFLKEKRPPAAAWGWQWMGYWCRSLYLSGSHSLVVETLTGAEELGFQIQSCVPLNAAPLLAGRRLDRRSAGCVCTFFTLRAKPGARAGVEEVGATAAILRFSMIQYAQTAPIKRYM